MVIKIDLKRGLLILPIIYVISLFFSKKLLNNFYFLYIGFFLNICIIFWNIPFFVTVLHTTPVYYEDLVLISNATNTNIHKLQNIFATINGIFTAGFITISFFYIFTYYPINNYSYIEILAILGGLGSINLKIQAVIGKGLLTVLYSIKNRDIRNNDMVLPYDNLSNNTSLNNNEVNFCFDNSNNPMDQYVILDMSNNKLDYNLDLGNITPVSHISSPSNRLNYMDDISRVTGRSVISTLWDMRNRGSPINRSYNDLVSLTSIGEK